MEARTEVMVALGVAVGVNCIPCFDNLYGKSKEVGLNDEEIKQIFRIAERVKGGAAMFIKKAVSDVTGEMKEKTASCGCPEGGGCT